MIIKQCDLDFVPRKLLKRFENIDSSNYVIISKDAPDETTWKYLGPSLSSIEDKPFENLYAYFKGYSNGTYEYYTNIKTHHEQSQVSCSRILDKDTMIKDEKNLQLHNSGHLIKSYMSGVINLIDKLIDGETNQIEIATTSISMLETEILDKQADIKDRMTEIDYSTYTIETLEYLKQTIINDMGV